MSDTTTITPEEKAEWRSLVMPYPDGTIGNQDKRMLRLLNALEQAEARAEKAEARVKARNKHIHTLLGEALENERNLDAMKSRWQTAEAENARLAKMVDWLAGRCAEHCCDRWGCDCTCRVNGCAHEDDKCSKPEPKDWAEAARRGVAAGEG